MTAKLPVKTIKCSGLVILYIKNIQYTHISVECQFKMSTINPQNL